jgi:hypothetical protein
MIFYALVLITALFNLHYLFGVIFIDVSMINYSDVFIGHTSLGATSLLCFLMNFYTTKKYFDLNEVRLFVNYDSAYELLYFQGIFGGEHPIRV